MKKSLILLGAALLMGNYAMAQFRANDKDGINVFETPKTEPAKFDGIKVNIGGAFTQSWQSLNHENTASASMKWDGAAFEYNPTKPNNGAKYTNVNALYQMKPGFNTANANMYFDVHLAEGVSLNMALYLSARHHNETWVKGGYIQFDKIPFIESSFIDDIMRYTTLKVGHMEVNYGDAHFRRSDNGNSIYNPFIENYIMDEFATEIGIEADVHYNNFLAVLSATNGEIKGDIGSNPAVVGATDGKRNPSIIAKLGYDKQLTNNIRLRVSGSGYFNSGAISNTLYGGDRSGSHYFGVIENANTTSTAFSGRYNPGFTDKISSMMGNVFLKVGGLEWFSTIESSKGRAKAEITGDRKATQIATDLVYRFGKTENFWLGGRYNNVTASVVSAPDVKIDRLAFSGGWFMTKNIMAKVEYVKQNYKDFAASDIRNGAKFDGIVVEAVVGF